MSLLLRPLEPEDAEPLLAWRNSPSVAANMYADHLICPEEHAAWFARARSGPRRHWLIEADGRRVGLASLGLVDQTAGRWDWAYYLGDPAVRGRGLGALTEHLVLEHAFGSLRARKLWCEVFLANEAVWKLHLSFGFQREALFRAHVLKGGLPQDVVGLGLLSSEWAVRRDAAAARLEARGLLASAALIDPHPHPPRPG